MDFFNSYIAYKAVSGKVTQLELNVTLRKILYENMLTKDQLRCVGFLTLSETIAASW